MLELVYEMNPWWQEDYPLIGLKRQKYLALLDNSLNNKDIIFITGLRRVGKSTILKQFISLLINEKNINPKTICFLSLDAYPFKDYSIFDLVREFRKSNNLKLTEKIYLFLDEVTYKDSFKQELKNFYDLGNIKIFASASCASKLVDKNAHLTGRYRIFEIEPLDFNEFLQFNNYTSKKSEKYMLEKYFEEYMEYGGIPEYVLTKDPTYITNLVDNILYTDIIAVKNIKNAEIIKDLFRLLCERVGKPLSYTKLANILGITKDSVKRYIGYFKETYLFFVIEKDARSLNERIVDNKKIYCADIGIKNVSTGFRDKGAIFENLVFLKIKANNPHFVKINGIEIDFIYKDNLIEVKYGQKLIGDQQKLFNSLKVKNKIIVSGINYFID